MEQIKEFNEITRIDERHVLLGQMTGGILALEKLHSAVSAIELRSEVPSEIRGQFNVARNMTLYSFFCFSLAPEVRMKSYSVMELALRTRFGDRETHLKNLVRRAVDRGLLLDRGFRHLEEDPENSYSRSLIDVLPSLRNEAAHGSTLVTPDCLGHIEKCADFVNQIFVNEERTT